MTRAPRDHPQRIELANEIHARPPEALEAPERITYLALTVGKDEREAERRHLASLCEHFGVAPPPPEANHFSARLGALRLKWERHTEFTGYGFYLQGLGPGPFEELAAALLPEGWLAAISGETIAAAHTLVVSVADDQSYVSTLAKYLPTNCVAGAEIADGAGYAFTDFTIGDDGYEHFVVIDRHRSAPGGRMAKALFEIEAYRVMALLAPARADAGTACRRNRAGACGAHRPHRTRSRQ